MTPDALTFRMGIDSLFATQREGFEMKRDASTRWVVSVFGTTHRSGPWHGAEKIRAVAVFGDSVLDMRGSHPADAELRVAAVAVFGDVKVLAPEDTTVELTGVAVFGDNTSNVPAGSASTTATPLRVKGLAMLGDVKVS